MPTEAVWLEERKTGITATDIAAIAGLHWRKTPLHVYLDKIGEAEPVAVNDAMRMGQLLEPAIGLRYSEITGNQVIDAEPFTLSRHRSQPLHLATPDAHAYTKALPAVNGDKPLADPTSRILLEKKAPGFRALSRWGETGTQVLPEEYLIQCQWQMHVEDLNRCDLAALIGGQEMRVYTIEADPELQDMLVSRANDFWANHVEKQVPPPIDDTKDYETHLRHRYPVSLEAVVTTDDDLEQAGLAYMAAQSQLKQVERELQYHRNQLIAALGESDKLVGDQFSVTYRTSKARKLTDWKNVVVELLNDGIIDEELVEAYVDNALQLKPGTRRFLFQEVKINA